MVTLVCLHGSDGHEELWGDFPERIAPMMSIVKLRGPVTANPGFSFFAKGPSGELIVEELNLRGEQLVARLRDIVAPTEKLFLMGYSSGATIASHVCLRYPETIQGAVLFRPQPTGEAIGHCSTPDLPVLIVSGRRDARRNPDDGHAVAARFQAAGAKVDLHVLDIGHGLDQHGHDFEIAKDWVGKLAI